MAEKKLPRHERMYKKKPHLERDEDGKMAVTEKQKEADKEQSGDDKMKMEEKKGEGLPMQMRHAHERRDMHHRHETEHAMHEHSGGGSKKEMHKRHEQDMKDMHSRHEKEIEAGEAKMLSIDGKNENKAGERAEKKGD